MEKLFLEDIKKTNSEAKMNSSSIVKALVKRGYKMSLVNVYDTWVNREEIHEEYDIKLLSETEFYLTQFWVVPLATAHKDFETLDIENLEVIFDSKSILNKGTLDNRL